MTFGLLTGTVFFFLFFVFLLLLLLFLSRPAPFSFFKHVKWRKLDERTSKQDSNESLKIFLFVCSCLFFLSISGIVSDRK